MGDQRIRTVTCLPIFIFATFDNWTNPCPTILIDMIDAVSRETTFGGKPSLDLKTNLSRNESLTLTEIILKGCRRRQKNVICSKHGVIGS